MNADNSDAREQFNVVIVGTGAIGSAMARDVLKRHQGARVVMLGRSNGDRPRDSRVTFVAFDASDPDSIVASAADVEKLFSRVHLLINTAGLLHSESQQPEKNLRAIRADNL